MRRLSARHRVVSLSYLASPGSDVADQVEAAGSLLIFFVVVTYCDPPTEKDTRHLETFRKHTIRCCDTRHVNLWATVNPCACDGGVLGGGGL